MQYYPSRSELWLSAPSDGSGDVLIYNTERESFYRFSGIGADRLLASAEDALFLRGTELMQMNNALTTDEGEREIDALYESGWLDFGYPERTKRTVRYLLEGDPDGGEITLRMQSERGNVAAAVFTGNAERVPNAYGGRMTVGRFRYLSYSLTARGTGRATVRALTVTARK